MENKEKSLEELRLENERLQMEIKRKELELKERELSVLEKKERRTEKIAESVTGAKNIVQRVVPVLLKIIGTPLLSFGCGAGLYHFCVNFTSLKISSVEILTIIVIVVSLPVSYFIVKNALKLIGGFFSGKTGE